MFPETADLPQSTAADAVKSGLGKSFLFDFKRGDFVLQDGKLTVAEDIDALKVWIEKILRTMRDEYEIYEGTPYGSRLDDLLVGSTYTEAFIASELRREMEDALLQHPQITGVSIFEIERTTSGANVILEVALLDKRTDTIKITF